MKSRKAIPLICGSNGFLNYVVGCCRTRKQLHSFRESPSDKDRRNHALQEDNELHENQIRFGDIIQSQIDNYVTSFTFHGLTKVLRGSRIESLFWLFLILVGISISVTIIHGLILKFLNHGIYTENRIQISPHNHLPAITICENQLLEDAYYAYCNVAPRIKHVNKSIHCPHTSSNPVASISVKDKVWWSNNIFNITGCRTMDGLQCASEKYFKSLKHYNHSCITFNYGGHLEDLYNFVKIEFEFRNPSHLTSEPSIFLSPHDPDIPEVDITRKVQMQVSKSYTVKLDKTVIKRLPHPFPSNCTNSKAGDIYSGKYTRTSCIESHAYVKMYKSCGDAPDYVKTFITKEIQEKYRQHRPIREVERCLYEHAVSEIQKKDCNFPCEELDLSIISTFLKGESGKYAFSIQYKRADAYMLMEERELYSATQMACEIGGMIVLFIGSSAISIIEIIAYLALSAFKKIIARYPELL